MSTSKDPNAREGIAMEVGVKEDQVQAPPKATIGTLPDEALLEIFHFYLAGEDENGWHTLVHVCRRWRLITFGSPCRLNLRLLCTEKTPVREMLDIWPAFPVIVSAYTEFLRGTDNVFAALEHHDRVSSVIVRAFPHSLWERLIEVMQRPFQALTHLLLWSYRANVRHVPAVLPDSFLGGSVPCLRALHFVAIPFPGLWKLLLSASNLVCLMLERVPDSMYISPEAMVTCLSALTRLQTFKLAFDTPQSLSHRASRYQPSTYVDLPALILFQFAGIGGYLEDLVLQINAPLLNTLEITLFDHHLVNASQLPRFIDRTGNFRELNKAEIVIRLDIVVIFSATRGTDPSASIRLNIPHDMIYQQFPFITRVLPPSFSRLECLYIRGMPYSYATLQRDMGAALWQELLHPFTALQDLYLAEDVALHVAPALQQPDETRVTEMLPALRNLFLEGSQPSGAAQQFAAQRQLSGHPVAVHSWDGRD